MGTLHRLMKRFQQLISGDQQKQEQQGRKQDINNVDREGYTYGHISDGERTNESRVLYHYPKQGKFRFPLAVDGEEHSQPKRQAFHLREEEQKEDQEKIDKNKETSINRKQETKKHDNRFANRDFKLTAIPSPIYGFRGREETKSKLDDTLSVFPFEDKERQEQVVTAPVLESNRPELVEEDKDQSTVPNIVPPVMEQAQSDFIDDQSVDEEMTAAMEETTQEEAKHEIADEEVIKESEQLEVAATIETIPVEETIELEMADNLLEQPLEKTEDRSKQSHEASPTLTQKDKPVKKPAIPFNVMMLPQDRGNKKPLEQVSKAETSAYQFPSIQLLDYPQVQQEDESEWLEEQGMMLEETLQSFHVDAKVVHVTKGPSVTRFEIQPARGVKVNKVTGLTDDIKLALAAKDIRIEAPIPGKNTIGIEVPNRSSTPVFLREILRRDVFIRSESPLTVALGLDISGQPIVTDLKKMPHGLVAGATGSGKSVCINSVLISLLFKANPDEVKLLLIDPKMVELAPYNGLPHLVTPVITDAKQATAALKWVVQEMERRYELFSQQGVRDVARYNSLYSETPDKPALPYILVVIDELADLMMVAPQEVEDSICRIAQKARACGIHLLLATQRPSVDVITGLIKANIPTRIAFSVSSQTDSRTILDMGGAERLLGRGDMLFHENGTPKPVRVQGTFVSDEEIEDIIAHVKKQREPHYLLETEQLKHVSDHSEADDEIFEEACYYVIEQGGASASSLQRRFRVGYNRAARLIDMMEERGIISQAMGSKPRHVLVDEIGIEEILYHKEV